MSELAWYCVHTKPKCEHIAAALLCQLEGVEAYCPRIRFQRSTPRGKVWFTEALFPSYLFARYDSDASIRAEKHAQNVIRVIEFGGTYLTIPEKHIEELRREMGGQDVREVKVSLKVGDVVELTEGPMRGFKGIIDRLANGEDRARILLEFLGREIRFEIDSDKLLRDQQPRVVMAKK